MSDIEQHGIWKGEVRMLHRDGHIGWVESVVVPVLGDDGLPISVRWESIGILASVYSMPRN